MYEKIDEVRNKLKEYTPQNLKKRLPLLERLLKLHYNATVEVDIERALYMTTHLKHTEHLNSLMPIRRAGAISSYLSRRKIVFHDNNMLAGSTTGKALGAPLYPEFFGLSIWPELGSISTRDENPQFLDKKDAEILNFEVFPYWMEK